MRVQSTIWSKRFTAGVAAGATGGSATDTVAIGMRIQNGIAIAVPATGTIRAITMNPESTLVLGIIGDGLGAGDAIVGHDVFIVIAAAISVDGDAGAK